MPIIEVPEMFKSKKVYQSKALKLWSPRGRGNQWKIIENANIKNLAVNFENGKDYFTISRKVYSAKNIFAKNCAVMKSEMWKCILK